MDESELNIAKLSDNFADFLPLFFEDKYSEAFGLWSNDEFSDIVYK